VFFFFFTTSPPGWPSQPPRKTLTSPSSYGGAHPPRSRPQGPLLCLEGGPGTGLEEAKMNQYSTCKEWLLILFSKILKGCQKQLRKLKWESIVQPQDDFQSLWKYVSLLFHNLGIISANCRKFIVSTISATIGNWFQELPEIFLIYDFRPILGNYFQCMTGLSKFHVNCIGRCSVAVMVVVFKSWGREFKSLWWAFWSLPDFSVNFWKDARRFKNGSFTPSQISGDNSVNFKQMQENLHVEIFPPGHLLP
jgi:hypothetical protein